MRPLSNAERAIVDLEIEKSKLNREKSMLVLNKSLILYFGFLLISIVGFVNNYITQSLFNILIIMGLIVLVIGIVPYIKTMREEERHINKMISYIKSGNFDRLDLESDSSDSEPLITTAESKLAELAVPQRQDQQSQKKPILSRRKEKEVKR